MLPNPSGIPLMALNPRPMIRVRIQGRCRNRSTNQSHYERSTQSYLASPMSVLLGFCRSYPNNKIIAHPAEQVQYRASASNLGLGPETQGQVQPLTSDLRFWVDFPRVVETPDPRSPKPKFLLASDLKVSRSNNNFKSERRIVGGGKWQIWC